METSYSLPSSSCRIVLTVGDITKQSTQAIVNAANGTLLGGGGVDGAIHRAAGPELLTACQQLASTLPNHRLPTGSAVITPGFRLNASHVIHCVGPVYRFAGANAPKLLASCYIEAMNLCRDNQLESVAFPSISTGAYGYPIEEAAPIALRTVIEQLAQPGPLEHVVFCLFSESDYDTYLKTANQLLS